TSWGIPCPDRWGQTRGGRRAIVPPGHLSLLTLVLADAALDGDSAMADQPTVYALPNPVKGSPPLILHPDECWYCGPCVDDCPRPGAIRLNHPLQQRVRWKRKDSGEHFRV